MSIVRKAGTTDVSVVIRIIDSADGTPETGVTSATGGLALEYRREGAVSTAITEADLTNLNDAHSDGGMKHIGNGYYRLDLPDAACASGATGVLVHGTVTGMVVIGEYIQLTAYDPYDTVRLGLTALPNAAADAAGGLPISDAGGLDLDSKLANTNEVTAARMGALTDWIDGGRLDLILDSAKVDTAAILADTGTDGVVVAAGSKTGYSLSAAQTFDLTGSITGNLSGSVGSVTGNVGGNVAGSVASVTAGVTVTTNNDKTGYALSATGSAAMTEDYAALGAAATLPQLLYEVRALLAEKSISSTTLTTKKLDGSTTAATYTLDDATTPSAITRAT